MAEPTLNTVLIHRCIAQWRAGDRGAADALLSAASSRLERLARKMLRGFPNVKAWADTGDVLNSALLRLWRTLEKIQPDSTRSFFNLAAVQIRRELLDLARHFAGHRYSYTTGGNESGKDPLAEIAAAGDSADELELWRCFHDAVEELPAEESEVVSLTFYHGWTQPQIAELLHISERTVRRRWDAACMRLAEKVGGLPPV